MLNVVKIPVGEVEKYNCTNQKEYNPFYFDGDKLIIDETWFGTLLPETQEQLMKYNVNFTSVKVPHEFTSLENDDINNIFNSMFEYQKWYSEKITNGPKNVSVIKLSTSLKAKLAKISKVRHLVGRNVNGADLDDLDELEKVLPSSEGWFIRLSNNSGKHDRPLKPVHNFKELVDQLTNSKEFLNIEYEPKIPKESYLIILPWETRMEKKYEFRLFVYNRKITCASQQEWYKSYSYTDQEIGMFLSRIQKIKFIEDLPYQNCVVDVWFNPGDSEFHLIECNPFGTHCSSGSNLFNWISDSVVLHGGSDFELRVVA